MSRVLYFLLLTLTLAAASALPATAQSNPQSAQDFFDAAAQTYIAGNTQQAKAQVETGLQAHPSDPKLQALRERLEQERQQQQSGGSSNQGQPQDQNQNNPSSGEQDEPNDAEPSSPSDEQQDGEPQDGQSEQEPQPSDSAPDENEAQDEGAEASGPGDAQPADPNRITKQQAQRILQAMQNQEEQLLRQVQRRNARPQRVEKDW